MSLGEVDTLALLSEKLDGLFNESQGYYESFLDANTLYKNGKMSDREFFQKMGDYIVAYSALEFLSIKVIMELKKSLDRIAGGKAPGGTQSAGLMPGMGVAGMATAPPPRAGTPGNPVGGPAGVISAQEAFSQPGILPTPDMHMPAHQKNQCVACGAVLKESAKFCTKCGAKV